jgi:hypothetical protein
MVMVIVVVKFKNIGTSEVWVDINVFSRMSLVIGQRTIAA